MSENNYIVPEVNEVATDHIILGPGARLKKAREEASITISDAAARLRLTETMLTDIEKDDFSKVTNLTYMRGYLRSYAKLLSLSGDEIIETFNRMQVEEVKSDRPVYNYELHQATIKDKPVRWITYVIVFSIILLVALWLRSQHNNSYEKIETTPIVELEVDAQPKPLVEIDKPAVSEKDKAKDVKADKKVASKKHAKKSVSKKKPVKKKKNTWVNPDLASNSQTVRR